MPQGKITETRIRAAWNSGVSAKMLAIAASLSLLAGPTVPLASAQTGANSQRTLPTLPPIRDDSPVKCRPLEYLEPVIVGGRFKGNRYATTPPMTAPTVVPTPPPPPSPVVSAPPPPSAPDIVVSGQKRVRTTYSTPIAVTTIGSANIGGSVNTDRERYAGEAVSTVKAVAAEPVSTFSVDVDTGSYANVRRFLNQGQLPPQAAVRTEEILNYFRYDYAKPETRSIPFSVSTDMATTPWNPNSRLLRIGINGYDIPKAERPATNLVFLVDVSGSMSSKDKLPLVRDALSQLADNLTRKDKVSIVVYAGAAGIVLEPTNNPIYVKQALSCLEAGGSTAGGQGMELAYATAQKNFIKGGVNRVIMATDGDFNVGISSTEGIEQIVKKNRESGITLTTLGFGQGNYNEAMMEKVADIGNGNYAYIDGLSEAQKVLSDEMAGTIFTIAKDVKIQIEFNPAAVSEYRLIGYENRILNEQDFDNDKVDAGDIGSGHQVTALYEIIPAGAKGWLPARRYDANKVAGKPGPANELAWLKLRYKLPDGDASKLIERAVPVAMIRQASAPSGDMGFAVAVAAFGQKLRGDTTLGNLGWGDITRLAGSPWQPLRKEFVGLVGKAEALDKPGRIQPYDPLPPEPLPLPQPRADACGASKVQAYVGQLATPAARRAIAQTSGAQGIRWIEPGMAVTMDYREDRLNAELSGQGVINRLSCG